MTKISTKMMKGIVDMHVHSNPDIRNRKYDDIELMEAGIKVGAKAIVIKTHQGTTMDRAYLCNRHNEIVNRNKNDFKMIGSITLNEQVGGINPLAVEVALKLGAQVVWLPTQSARNHFNKSGKSEEDSVDVVINGKVVPELIEIIKLIKQYDAVLGTAHASPEEIFTIVDYAKNMGLNKIVVTHPEWWMVGMTLEDQKKIVKEYNVYLERCFAQPMGGGKYKSNLEDNLKAINEIGYENIIISTDGGQVENPAWEVALASYIDYLADNGISEEKLYHMTHTIQYNLLNLD